MPVPNTDTFSLQDVVDEIAGTQTSLSACFTDADAAGFNPLYEGSKNELNDFRDYDDNPGVTVTSISLGVGTSGPNACSNFSTPVTRYYSPAGVGFASATQLWTNTPGTTLAASSYYSDGGIHRNWNGTAFVGDGLCL